MSSSNVQRHPTTEQQFRNASSRWLALKEQHRIACDRMWAGTIARHFTDYELSLLKERGYVSEYDRALIRQVTED